MRIYKYDSWLGKLFGLVSGCSSDQGYLGFAVTFGQTTYFSCAQSVVDACTGGWWRKHEDTHAGQYITDGWIKFLSRYIWQLLSKGYLNIDYEIAARTAAFPLGGPEVGPYQPKATGIYAILGVLLGLTLATGIIYYSFR
jgi:hypothetical protein